MRVTDFKTDYLVIGGGIAGLRAAIGASRHGRVTILNKGVRGESSSEFAQGGIAAALSEGAEDIHAHIQDTCIAGNGLCREEAVRILVEEGPGRIRELLSWGVSFDKVGEEFVLAREGAHSQNRILRARGDATGNEIIKTLQRIIRSNENISILNGLFTTRLLTATSSSGEKYCYGAVALDEDKGCLRSFFAKSVILATGGLGQIFQRTTNPLVATGDGLVMALRAGAELEDMEFVQFHPTALLLPGAPSFLLSEAIRGEGGLLRNAEGKRFMDRYHPDAELAPRDVVSRAMLCEIAQGDCDHVFLDVTHLKPGFVCERFPMIYETCLRFGIDMALDQIPVAPSAHYMMGGVKTDLLGKTNISGLYAVGEVASTGVHGANRLASNSLLEGLVFGARAGDAVGEERTIQQLESCFQDAFFFSEKDQAVVKTPDEYRLAQKAIKTIMWKKVGILRSEHSLRRAIDSWQTWCGLLRNPPMSRLGFETVNMFWAAALVIESALMRRESLGAHFREDFPDKDQTTSPRHSQLNQSHLERHFSETGLKSLTGQRPLS